KTQQVPYIRLTIDIASAGETAEKLVKKAPKQSSLLKFLSTQAGPVSLAEAKLKASCDKAVVDALILKELIAVDYIEVHREPLAHYQIQISQPLSLTDAQEAVFK